MQLKSNVFVTEDYAEFLSLIDLRKERWYVCFPMYDIYSFSTVYVLNRHVVKCTFVSGKYLPISLLLLSLVLSKHR